MAAREVTLALTLLAGTALVVYGVSLWSVPAAFILSGLAVVGLGVLFLTEVG